MRSESEYRRRGRRERRKLRGWSWLLLEVERVLLYRRREERKTTCRDAASMFHSEPRVGAPPLCFIRESLGR